MKSTAKKILEGVLVFVGFILCVWLAVFIGAIVATDRNLRESIEYCPHGEHKGVYQYHYGHVKCYPAVKLSNSALCINETWRLGNSTSVFDLHDDFLANQDDYENGTSRLTHSNEIDDLLAAQLITECKTKLNEKGLLLPPP